MKVYIIGAGPGDPDLITVKGRKIISRAKAIIYTGSLVPREVLMDAPADAKIWDSKGMTLDEIMNIIQDEIAKGHEVARVHTGDPSIFGSTAEQVRRFQEAQIPYEIIPGVSSVMAAAAAVGKELTLPEVSQTVIITRAEGRTPVPSSEDLQRLAESKATLALFLSITLLRKVVRQIKPIYGDDCPVVVVYKASCPDQKIIWGQLGDIVGKVQQAKITSQSMILIGRVLDCEDFADSRLYSPSFSHKFRQAEV
ncbi:MAG: precorrin-4 C(11)-methyltransferase [Oligoflexus sp.]